MRVKWSLQIVLAFVTVCGVSCTTSAKKVDAVSTAELTAQKAVVKDSLPKDVTDWRAFFKPAPSPEERSSLARKIDGWKESGDPDTILQRGHDETAMGRLSEADRSFREVLRLRPDSTDAMLGAAEVSLRRRQPERAFELLARVEDVMRTRDENPAGMMIRYRFVRAMALIGRGERADGNKELNDLIAEDSTFNPAYAALAASYLAAQKDDAAAFIAKRGLDRGIEDPALYNILGVVAERAKRTSEADNWYTKSLQINKAFVPALVNKGKIKLQKEDVAGAIADLGKALEYAPEDIDALVTYGVAQRRQKNTGEARRVFQKAIDVDPDSAAARFNLGVLMAEDLRQPGVALRLFHEVIQSRDDNRRVKDQAKAYIGEIDDGHGF